MNDVYIVCAIICFCWAVISSNRLERRDSFITYPVGSSSRTIILVVVVAVVVSVFVAIISISKPSFQFLLLIKIEKLETSQNKNEKGKLIQNN